MREIALDTETTGLNPGKGDRIVEIACVELRNHIPTGEMYQQYINPLRDMPDEAFRVHGLSAEFLADFPRFEDVSEDFLAFIGDDPLVIHNAEFDVRFLNAELARLDHPGIPMNRTIDTLHMARRKFPGAQASLDALCRRFGIDLSGREKHRAIIDTELLAQVYLELIGGSQPGLELAADNSGRDATGPVSTSGADTAPSVREPRPHAPSDAERTAHSRMLEKITEPVWLSN